MLQVLEFRMLKLEGGRSRAHGEIQTGRATLSVYMTLFFGWMPNSICNLEHPPPAKSKFPRSQLYFETTTGQGRKHTVSKHLPRRKVLSWNVRAWMAAEVPAG